MSALPAIAEQSQVAEKQDEGAACYAAKLSKAEAKINWSQSAEEIERAVRAYNSWPVAYCYYQKNSKTVMLRVWQADVIKGVIKTEVSSAHAVPGQVIAESAQGIDVATAEGLLRITQLQAEGKRKMRVADFLNANTLLGQVLN